MDAKDVKEKLWFFFQNNILYDESVDEIDENESLIDKGFIDSTGIIGLVSFIEKTFGINVQDSEIIPENFDSMSNIFNYINNKVENDNSTGIGMVV